MGQGMAPDFEFRVAEFADLARGKIAGAAKKSQGDIESRCEAPA